MGTWVRRLRGMLGTAVTWGAGWFGLGSIALTGLLWGQAPLRVIFSIAAGVGVAGMVAGAGFSLMVGLVEGQRTIEELSFARFALWGALGGLLVGLPFIGNLAIPATVFYGILAALGATSAAGTLAIAKLATDSGSVSSARDRAMLSGSTDG